MRIKRSRRWRDGFCDCVVSVRVSDCRKPDHSSDQQTLTSEVSCVVGDGVRTKTTNRARSPTRRSFFLRNTTGGSASFPRVTVHALKKALGVCFFLDAFLGIAGLVRWASGAFEAAKKMKFAAVACQIDRRDDWRDVLYIDTEV